MCLQKGGMHPSRQVAELEPEERRLERIDIVVPDSVSEGGKVSRSTGSETGESGRSAQEETEVRANARRLVADVGLLRLLVHETRRFVRKDDKSRMPFRDPDAIDSDLNAPQSTNEGPVVAGKALVVGHGELAEEVRALRLLQ